jgi:hypothetical protein
LSFIILVSWTQKNLATRRYKRKIQALLDDDDERGSSAKMARYDDGVQEME